MPNGKPGTWWRRLVMLGVGLSIYAPGLQAGAEPAQMASPAAVSVAPPMATGGPVGNPSSPLIPSASADSPDFSDYTYKPSGRRDPFLAIIKEPRTDEESQHIPPLQRLAMAELNLIGIVWGGFGYSAMVQTPDGRGYTIRQGTRIGPNNGVVHSITENAVVVQERFTDVFGNKQVREYVKLLHAKEGSE